MKLDLRELSDFLVCSKKSAYAGGGAETPSQEPGFKEFEVVNGLWRYKDSYSGNLFFQGREVVWYDSNPVWQMGYGGGMLPSFQKNTEFVEGTYAFLREAFSNVIKEAPYRGLLRFKKGHYLYYCIMADELGTGEDIDEEKEKRTGDITDFCLEEYIIKGRLIVYSLRAVGGLIVPKIPIEIIRPQNHLNTPLYTTG